MADVTDYVVDLSYRFIGDARKQYVKKPSWGGVLKLLQEIESGKIEFLSLIGPQDDFTHMTIIAKPSKYHIGIFINEDEEYLFKVSDMTSSKVDIAGEYWPEFQICTSWDDLVSVVRTFFETGKPSESYDWIYFCEDD